MLRELIVAAGLLLPMGGRPEGRPPVRLSPGTTSTIRFPAPHPGQRAVMAGAKRFNVLSAGRRWRKTTLFGPLSITTALRGGHVVWGAPVYDQVYTAWEEVRKMAGDVAKYRETRMTADFPGGGRISFRSLDDPDNARGKTADGVVIDEAADVHEKAWFEVLRPMLMDTNGWAWIGGTPKGRNWFYREYKAISDPDDLEIRRDSAAWQIPTLGVRITPSGDLERAPHPYENPAIPFSEMVSAFRRSSEQRFRQEYLAEFVDDAGGVFRRVLERATSAVATPYAGHFVLGVDWGKSHDFTVLTLLDVKTMRVVDFDRFNRIDWHFQLGRLKALYQRWRDAGAVIHVVAERNSMGDMPIEYARRDGVPITPFETTNLSKQQIVEHLSLAIENGSIAYPNIPVLVNELQAFESTRMASGLMRYSAPDGEHDDCVISLALAAFGAKDAEPMSEDDFGFGSSVFGDSTSYYGEGA